MGKEIMPRGITRRLAMAGLATPFLVRGASAQAPLTLDRLKQAGVVRIGLVNQPPYSGLNPDGTIGGFVPTLVRQIMGKLGVPRVEPFVASYGELIPGLQAGRWQMIAAAFRLTKERCGQVLFTDPVTFDGGAFAYIVKDVPQPPASLKALAASSLRVGVLQGSYLVKMATDLGIPQDRLLQFPSNPAMIDGLRAGRVAVAVSTNAALRQLHAQRGGYEIVYPVPEDSPVGSAPAFARGDVELHAAFQAELRAMRASGALNTMAGQFGFDPPPANLAGISGEDACRRL